MDTLNIINNYNAEDYITASLISQLNEGETKDRNVDENDDIRNILMEMHLQGNQASLELDKFKTKVRDDLLFEAIYYVYKPTLKDRISPRTEALSKTLVKDFISENGSYELLKRYKHESSLLSNLYSIIENYAGMILEKVDKDNVNTFSIDTDLKDDFFNTLEAEDFQSISTLVNQRIAGAIDEFIIDNQQTKAQIRDIVSQTKERIDTKQNMPQDIEEAYNEQCKTRIANLKRNKTKTVLEALIYNIAESAIRKPELREVYFSGNKPDMDLIVDEATTVYSLLETLNTYKFARVNEDYIVKTLDSFRM